MSYVLPFIMAVVFVGINGLTMLAFARSQGFRLKPSGLAFLAGGFMVLIAGIVTPLSGQSAFLAVSGRVEQEKQRVAALLLAAIVSTILGVTGSISGIMNFAGPAVIAGMMAGVGLMLAQVGVDFVSDKVKGNLIVGLTSVVSALLIFAIADNTTPGNNALVYTVAGSVAISTIVYWLVPAARKGDVHEDANDTSNYKFWTKAYWTGGEWSLVKPRFTFRALLSAAALICLGIGITTSFGTVNMNMAGGAEAMPQNFDHLMLITGLTDFIGVIFGGMPLEPIISATAATQWPVMGAFVLMIVLGVLCILGFVLKLCKYLPAQSIAGFLVVIGVFSTFLPNIRPGVPGGNNFASEPISAAVAMGVTALTKNPFIGMVAGILVRYIGTHFGLPV
ncbi:MAG: xanthine/uracil permease [Defluviitaleaceae bacterium]|nr:xanthine/uracil permease [Defluviitaleaceae bacterium]